MRRQHSLIITKEQRTALDAAILQAIKSGVGKAGKIAEVPAVQSVVADLPRGKHLLRWVDGALQRLRGNGVIRFGGGTWSASKARS